MPSGPGAEFGDNSSIAATNFSFVIWIGGIELVEFVGAVIELLSVGLLKYFDILFGENLRHFFTFVRELTHVVVKRSNLCFDL